MGVAIICPALWPWASVGTMTKQAATEAPSFSDATGSLIRYEWWWERTDPTQIHRDGPFLRDKRLVTLTAHPSTLGNVQTEISVSATFRSGEEEGFDLGCLLLCFQQSVCLRLHNVEGDRVQQSFDIVLDNVFLPQVGKLAHQLRKGLVVLLHP
uniref:Uncharacterized protein n=1 Tax=Chromera velia CCMP2878 TaxID=1169474 RepID=A0A0G4I725_9ALVE|eukprot:Cvel_11495.t1-p1 / transcript=Cvel_11495.t1 / gene=Cvel_11495 / organism=Chromera_velia_CCMP2878 / gene_product=hypothetical protein / transcript_product=hypothetical protein / location=Cvel_scaffold724:57880-58338(-) / protein_length=153 / sequence_SO=supercontig / SO=protein_coding / is_pseudo=false